MTVPGWLTAIRTLLKVGKELHYIGRQLERIADHYDGVDPPTRPAPEEDTSPVVARQPTDTEFAHFEATALELEQTLGRVPTADELARALDGEEHGPDEIRDAWTARRPDLRGPF